MKKIIEAKALKTINIHLHTPIAIYINNIYYPNKDTTAIHSHYGEKKIGLQILSTVSNGN